MRTIFRVFFEALGDNAFYERFRNRLNEHKFEYVDMQPIFANYPAKKLQVNYVIANKVRRGDRSVSIELTDPAGVARRPALIVDDIVSSGETLKACANVLASSGSTSIDAIVTQQPAARATG